MSRIKINDISTNEKVNNEDMKKITGGGIIVQNPHSAGSIILQNQPSAGSIILQNQPSAGSIILQNQA